MALQTLGSAGARVAAVAAIALRTGGAAFARHAGRTLRPNAIKHAVTIRLDGDEVVFLVVFVLVVSYRQPGGSGAPVQAVRTGRAVHGGREVGVPLEQLHDGGGVARAVTRQTLDQASGSVVNLPITGGRSQWSQRSRWSAERRNI